MVPKKDSSHTYYHFIKNMIKSCIYAIQVCQNLFLNSFLAIERFSLWRRPKIISNA